MLSTVLNSTSWSMAGVIIALIVSVVGIGIMKKGLPTDAGKEFAVNGTLSRGKPRGCGIVFITLFIIISLIFTPFSWEYISYCALLFISMLSGFLDDRSQKPWGGLKKGLIDLVIAVATALVFVFNNPQDIGFMFFGTFVTISPALYGVLATILIWAAINVTNCSDGVDGLCGCLSITTLLTLFVLFLDLNGPYAYVILLLIASILGYLWHNISPSRVLMGDAGSRALGFFIAVLTLKSLHPLLIFFTGFMLIADGGLGIVKVALLRLLKIRILTRVRTPLHDHVRKKRGWSDAQVVFRFTMIQIIASLIAIMLLQLRV